MDVTNPYQLMALINQGRQIYFLHKYNKNTKHNFVMVPSISEIII